MDNFRFEKSVPAVETDGLTSGMDEEIRYLDRIESKDPRTAQPELVFSGLRVEKSMDCSWRSKLDRSIVVRESMTSQRARRRFSTQSTSTFKGVDLNRRTRYENTGNSVENTNDFHFQVSYTMLTNPAYGVLSFRSVSFN